MKLFSLDIPLVATAYIKADSAEQALKLANEWMTETGIEFSSRHQNIGEQLCIDGCPYACLARNDEAIALSPAMSLNTKAYVLDDIEPVAFELEGANDA